jgi:hypothetical protein
MTAQVKTNTINATSTCPGPRGRSRDHRTHPSRIIHHEKHERHERCTAVSSYSGKTDNHRETECCAGARTFSPSMQSFLSCVSCISWFTLPTALHHPLYQASKANALAAPQRRQAGRTHQAGRQHPLASGGSPAVDRRRVSHPGRSARGRAPARPTARQRPQMNRPSHRSGGKAPCQQACQQAAEARPTWKTCPVTTCTKQ